ncbi:hypothetical protein SAMN05216338_107533 [Bradyrhizobium sp. Rc2d]|nr:hypothetical protein SAMN05216338_106636 [Bradyrhizobium sp. Rc2d]SDJ95486.1 hypothetical protein SAMN05216338_107533 [Bradyrhizobium sp. Rc2d]
MRELVPEKLLTGEVLEIRVIDPAFADAPVGQTVDVLEQQQPDDEAACDPRPALLAVERCDLAIDRKRSAEALQIVCAQTWGHR